MLSFRGYVQRCRGSLAPRRLAQRMWLTLDTGYEVSDLVRGIFSCVPNGVRTRAAALKARIQHLLNRPLSRIIS